MTAFTDEPVPFRTSPRRPAERQRASRARKMSDQRPPDRRMIAWDGEGINLSGANKPQHYVLYGCSARVDDPLVITHPSQNLSFYQLADYMLETKLMFPDAYHVGYAFGYDQNMIIRSLRWSEKRDLYKNGHTWVRLDERIRYKVELIPKKSIAITRVVKGRHDDRTSTYIKIEDIFSFYGSSFIDAYTQTFPNADSEEGWDTIVEGKASRGDNKWEDLALVRRYWEYEIVALERLATGFRDMLWDNGFYLRQWYGPGAFANYLRKTTGLEAHEWGGKEENLPSTALHHAIKCAYYGGHFEQYMGGRPHDTVYGYDVNSAYPAAFCHLPSLREGGFWQELGYLEAQQDVRNPSSPLTVYHVKFRHKGTRIFQTKPMPLPWRDERGNVSYVPSVEGWYWSPEIVAILQSRRWNNDDAQLYVIKAWRWVAVDDSRPWRDVIEQMYQTRLALKSAGNPAQMVYKLGPNSLYGKMAQRVGHIDAEGDQPARPPRAHTLCIAGFLTSWCRAQILRMIDAVDDDQLIAVETDGLYTTAPPEQITARWPEVQFSKQLGDWGVDTYADVIYLQNGVYLTQDDDGAWSPKTRGISKSALPYDLVSSYCDTCLPGEDWQSLVVENGSQFIGLGLAILRATGTGGVLIASKAQRMHCVWYPDMKEIIPTGAVSSKRTHNHRHCAACRNGLTLNEGLHTLHIHQRSHGGLGYISHPYRLPWETRKAEQWRAAIGDTTDTQLGRRKVQRRNPHNHASALR